MRDDEHDGPGEPAHQRFPVIRALVDAAIGARRRAEAGEETIDDGKDAEQDRGRHGTTSSRCASEAYARGSSARRRSRTPSTAWKIRTSAYKPGFASSVAKREPRRALAYGAEQRRDWMCSDCGPVAVPLRQRLAHARAMETNEPIGAIQLGRMSTWTNPIAGDRSCSANSRTRSTPRK